MAESGLGFLLSCWALKRCLPAKCGLAVGVRVRVDPRAELETSYSDSGVRRDDGLNVRIVGFVRIAVSVVVDVGGIGDLV
jgi:hypothetical protein